MLTTALLLPSLVLGAALLAGGCRAHRGHNSHSSHGAHGSHGESHRETDLSDRDIDRALAHLEVPEEDRAELRVLAREVAREKQRLESVREVVLAEFERQWMSDSFDPEHVKSVVEAELLRVQAAVDRTAEAVARLHAAVPAAQRAKLQSRHDRHNSSK